MYENKTDTMAVMFRGDIIGDECAGEHDDVRCLWNGVGASEAATEGSQRLVKRQCRSQADREGAKDAKGAKKRNAEVFFAILCAHHDFVVVRGWGTGVARAARLMFHVEHWV